MRRQWMKEKKRPGKIKTEMLSRTRNSMIIFSSYSLNPLQSLVIKKYTREWFNQVHKNYVFMSKINIVNRKVTHSMSKFHKNINKRVY